MQHEAKDRIEQYLKGHPAATEYDFLFACCRAAFAGIPARYPDRIRQDVFLATVRHHKLVPQLYPVLKNRCENVPDNVLQEFRQLLRQQHPHILKLSGELTRLSGLFSARDIPWLSVKGPALSVQLYGDLAVRQSGDLDILVNECDLDRAKQLLRDAGYRSHVNESAFNKRQLRHYYQISASDQLWIHPAKRIHVELHWRLTHSAKTSPDNIELFRHKTEIAVGNSHIPTLDPTFHALYLCRHGSWHLWYRLFWLWDIAHIFQNISGEESEQLIVAARQFRLERVLRQSAWLAYHLFQIPLPPALSGRECPRSLLVPVLQHIVEARQDSFPAMWYDYLYRMRLQSGIRYRWSVSAPRMNNPRDWETVRLPECLFFVYYILKPFILFKRRCLFNRTLRINGIKSKTAGYDCEDSPDGFHPSD